MSDKKQGCMTTGKFSPETVFGSKEYFMDREAEMKAQIAALAAAKRELVEGMIDFMNSHGGGKKKCGHDYSCVCAWNNLKSLIAKYGEKK